MIKVIVIVRYVILPPANEVCEGYVSTGVCLSTGRTCMAGSGHAWWWWGGGHAWGIYTMTSDETREQTSKTISGNSIGKIKKSKGVKSWSWLHDIFV